MCVSTSFATDTIYRVIPVNATMDENFPFRGSRDYPTRETHILDRDLIKLGYTERYSFMIVITILIIISVLGNVATIYINMIRKKRPMYQACLLSLAASDLLTTIFSGAGYLNRLVNEMTLLWHLGELMCSLIPFFSTCAILASSVTLTAIALDRYRAIVRALKDNWEPGGCFSAASVIIVWTLAAGVSSPMWSSSTYVHSLVILTDPSNATSATGVIAGSFCANNLESKRTNLIFYTIVFCVIFLPLLVVFLWLYIVVAREVWVRRKPVAPINSPNEPSADTESSIVSRRNQSNNSSNSGQRPTSGELSQTGNSRRRKREKDVRMERKVRTFKIILVLMAVFFLCRLPTWIYVIVKHNLVDSNFLLQLYFNVLNLANSALNPFLYTFLDGTLSFTSKCRRFCKRLCLVCCSPDDDSEIFKEELRIGRGESGIGGRNGSLMVPRGPYAEENRRKQNFYQANVTQASNKPIMSSGVYLGNGIVDGDMNSNI